MPKYRQGRVDEEVRKELADILRNTRDDRIPLMTSIIKAHVTPDLKYAKVYVSVLGDADQMKVTVAALNELAPRFRKELSARIRLRQTPQLSFVADDSIAYGAHISKVLSGLDIPEAPAEDEENEEGDEE